MKNLRKSLAVLSVLSAGALAFALDFTNIDNTFEEISAGLDDFTDQLSVAVPQAATQQNVWADAYIGKLFPSAPPHLGGGFNAGFTHIDTSGLKTAADALNIDGVKDSYYFPVFTADLRIGGVFLPFDIDVAVMKTGALSTNLFGGADLTVDFLTVGVEARYALLQGGVVAPRVSIGAGYFYNQGSFGASSSYAETAVDYKIHTMYASAQVSKTFAFVTPFVGVRGFVSKYDNAWAWKINDETAVAALAVLGKKNYDSGSKATEKFDFNAVQPQLYFGCGVRFFFVDFTVSVSTDLRHIADRQLWSAAASLRLSL